jgi:hypothetical protein
MELTEADRGAISRNAYFKWLEAGAPPGDGVEYWLEAESEFLHDAGDDGPEQDAIEEAHGAQAAEWASRANPAGRARSRTDKEVLIGSRG